MLDRVMSELMFVRTTHWTRWLPNGGQNNIYTCEFEMTEWAATLLRDEQVSPIRRAQHATQFYFLHNYADGDAYDVGICAWVWAHYQQRMQIAN